MESNGMYSNMGSGMLGLEMSLHHVPPQQNPMQHQSHPPMVSYVDHRQQSQPPLRPGSGGGAYPSGNKPKITPGLTLSDEDDPGGPTADQNSADDGKRKVCPWQRMKWTDNMVRLLIMVVYYIGDEVGSEGNSNDPAAGNKKKAGAGAGLLQKKGKWKSVSRAMMERGFYVSPQQCEDKFNDLNKRYKRVNDIIGKGTACKVVENQTLLETLDLSPKMKEEAKKLLNSKHLFFREMCAYHNSCAHGGASGSAAADGGSDPTSQTNNHHQKCMHSSENVRIGPNLGRAEVEDPKDNDNDEDDEDSDDDEDEESEEDEEEEKSRKRARKTEPWSPLLEQMSGELTNVCEDSTRSPVEKRQWIKARTMQLEEQRVEFQSQALELEKQRLKWEKFSSKKEREMEREKMMNQRKKLENERMVLLLHQKELELNDVHHQAYNRTSDPSSVTG